MGDESVAAESVDLNSASLDELDPGLRERFWSKVEKQPGPDGCWLWKGAKTIRSISVHHLRYRATAYRLTKGPFPNGMMVDATCGNKKCVRPDHLEIIHPVYYVKRKGAFRSLRGEDVKTSTLTDSAVSEIKQAYLAGAEIADLKRSYDNRHNIHAIVSGKMWGHVGPQISGDYIKRRSAANRVRANIRKSKLSWAQILECKRLISERNLSLRGIARIFGVDHTVIIDIKQGKRWAHVLDDTSFIRSSLTHLTPPANDSPRADPPPAVKAWLDHGALRCAMSGKLAASFIERSVQWSVLAEIVPPAPSFIIDVPDGLLGEIAHIVVTVGPQVQLALATKEAIVEELIPEGLGWLGLAQYRDDPRDRMIVALVVETCRELYKVRPTWIVRVPGADPTRTASDPVDDVQPPQCQGYRIARDVVIDNREKVRTQYEEHHAKREGKKLTSQVSVRAHPAHYYVGHGEQKERVERTRKAHVKGPKDAPIAVRRYVLAEKSGEKTDTAATGTGDAKP